MISSSTTRGPPEGELTRRVKRSWPGPSPAGEGLDEIRVYELRRLGITVLRYSNLDINRNFKVVCDDILNHLK